MKRKASGILLAVFLVCIAGLMFSAVHAEAATTAAAQTTAQTTAADQNQTAATSTTQTTGQANTQTTAGSTAETTTAEQTTKDETTAGTSAKIQMSVLKADNASYVYDGIDYSAVFDPDYYYNQYGDLQEAIGYDVDGLLAHFVTFGMNEGRQASDAFNVTIYKANYADLRAAFGDDTRSYYLHYITNGQQEGRIANAYLSTTVYQGVDYAAVYNYSYYKAAYADLRAAFGDDAPAYLQHFVNFGMKEGRQAIASFNVADYANNYLDLYRAFGSDNASYYLHYMSFGRKENRTAGSYLNNGNYHGVNYSSVYDYTYYKASQSALAQKYGSNTLAYIRYFVESGMAAGQQASDSFNPSVYKQNYADLRKAFGDDWKSYYLHYMQFGKKEGRNATTLLVNKVKITDGGVYLLQTNLNTDYVIDTQSPHYDDGSPAMLWENDGTNGQKWKITSTSDGYYTLQTLGSDKMLTVQDNGASGTAVVQMAADGAMDQKWTLQYASDGTSVQIVSAAGKTYLTVQAADVSDGNGILVQTGDNSTAQKFSLTETSYTQVVADGYYNLTLGMDPSYAMEVTGGSEADGTNIQLAARSKTSVSQSFYVKYLGDGAYSIATAVSGNASMVDLASGDTSDHNNVQEWTSDSTDAQKWRIYYSEHSSDTGENKYVFISACSTTDPKAALDMAGDTPAAGNNIQVYHYNTTYDTQKYYLESTNVQLSNWVNKNGRKYLYDTIGTLFSTTGIDVSKWQGTIDWDQVAADDVKFAIIRVGHGTAAMDETAAYNMDECERLGIPYGVYLYSTATTDAMAQQEADLLLQYIKGRNPSMGVFIDMEDTDAYQDAGIDIYSTAGGETVTGFAAAIMSKVTAAGYKAGVYANTDYFNNVLDTSKLSGIRWVARYFTNTDTDTNLCPAGTWQMWQYRSTGSVAGISGNVDMNALILPNN